MEPLMAILATEWLLTIFSICLVAVQLYLRDTRHRAGAICAVASGVLSLLQVCLITPLESQHGNPSSFRKLALASTVIHHLLLLSIKSSILVFMNHVRKTASTLVNFLALAVTVYISVMFAVALLALLLWCRPLHTAWSENGTTCEAMNTTTLGIFFAWNVSSDLFLVLFLLYIAITTYLQPSSTTGHGVRLLSTIALQILAIAVASSSFTIFEDSVGNPLRGNSTKSNIVCILGRIDVTIGISANFVLLAQFKVECRGMKGFLFGREKIVVPTNPASSRLESEEDEVAAMSDARGNEVQTVNGLLGGEEDDKSKETEELDYHAYLVDINTVPP